MPVAGGEETEVVRGPVSQWSDWTLTRSALYYSTSRPRGSQVEYTIERFDLGSGRTKQLLRQVGSPGRAHMAVSPDEAWILFCDWPEGHSEVMLVENFR